MNELRYPEEKELRKIKKKIGATAFEQAIKDIKRYLKEGNPCINRPPRIKDFSGTYKSPGFRLRSGDYRVLYDVDREPFSINTVYIIDMIHRKELIKWLKQYGVRK